MSIRRGVLLIDHGSRFDAANMLLHDVVSLVQSIAPDGILVCAAHMELAEPTVAQGFAECVRRGADEIIAIPYMLAPGRHATNDIPRLVADAARQHNVPFRVTEPLGLDVKIASLVLERANVMRSITYSLHTI